jgi:polysaccharide pyruvyl transferase WcaK-like protein
LQSPDGAQLAIFVMTNHSPAKQIGIFGHVGTLNLGDETIIAAVLQNIRLRYPDAQIRAFTFNPDDTQARHGITSYPIRRTNGFSPGTKPPASVGPATQSASEPPIRQHGIKDAIKRIPVLYPAMKGIRDGFKFLKSSFSELIFLGSCYENLKGTDLLIVAGSGQLTDHSGGAWAYPYTFFKWSLLARALGTKLAFVSIGTGWIDSPLSKFFLKSALSRADYRSCRDERSEKQVQRLGISGESIVVPDLAYSLNMPPVPVSVGPRRSRPLVGINPIPFYHEKLWHQADKQIYEKYVETQAGFASWLVHRGYDVLFFPTQLRADPPAIQDIIAAIQRRDPATSGQVNVNSSLRSPEDLIAAMSQMDFIVAARFHGVLISHLLHKPVLAVSYHHKTADLMARMGQSESAVEIDDCTLDALTSRFILLESRSATIAAELERRVPICRKALESQYDRVFSLLEQGTA